MVKDKEYFKQYYKDNKEKLKLNSKNNKLNNVEKNKKYMKQYKIDNKEKINTYKKQWLDKNLDYNSKYYRDNHKKITIEKWKQEGIIIDDYEEFYDYFIIESNCWICNKIYNTYNVSDFKCLDHDHDLLDEPNIRYICCNYCNLHIVR